MRGLLIGLLLGGVLGAGATWAALEQPWKSDAQPIAAAEADAGPDEGAAKNEKKRRRRRRRTPGAGEAGMIQLSPAQKALQWKGPSVKVPPKSMDFETGAGGRALEQSEINQGIESGAPAVVRCVETARGNAELSAAITLKMLVGPDGRVTKYRMRAPRYLFEQGLYGCVKSATAKMRFPATGAHTAVTLPLTLD